MKSPPRLADLSLNCVIRDKLAEADVALHQPRQLGVLGHVALHEHRGDVGIEADGEEDRRQLDRALADDARLARRR